MLLTSGSTAMPKRVPLTHCNICISAASHVRYLDLTAADRTLNMLPLFNGNLTFSIFAPLSAGGSVICTTGIDTLNVANFDSFFAALRDLRPTLYTGTPAAHRRVLDEIRHRRVQVTPSGLRLIRSLGGPLSAALREEVSRVFATPVIQSYGMTETASVVMTADPLPSAPTKPGSVGRPYGLEVQIMEERGAALLPTPGQVGEIVVRGPSVMGGYDNDPAANELAFAGDWFRTGDLGCFDDDGFLFIVGRAKEVIYSGGAKVSPADIDAALLAHPRIVDAVTFSVPDPVLGEAIAAAIVPRDGIELTPEEIVEFLSGRIAPFKIPRDIIFVEPKHIPRTANGKALRNHPALQRLSPRYSVSDPSVFV
jgi:acyl-CoA synthetase (AMP-forming)/AMP-acid ligase II